MGDRRYFLAWIASVSAVASACSLASDFDGLSNPPDTADGSANDGSTLAADAATNADVEPNDATADGSSSDADGGTTCGLPGPTAGLIAYYPFDEGSGDTVHDCSPNALHGKILAQGATSAWTTGKKGGAIRVSEPNGCVELGTGALLQPSKLSAAMWIAIDSFPSVGASGYLLGKSLNANFSGYRIGTRTLNDAGQIAWTQGVNGTTYDEGVNAPATGSFHHLAITFAPNDKLEIFIDGVSVHVKTGIPDIAYTSASLRIGCRADDANYFAGRIDELRIYDRVLSPAEIAALAQ